MSIAPTPTQLKAHQRRAAFHQSISEKAAAIKQSCEAPATPVVKAALATVVDLDAPVPPPVKKNWFWIEGVTAPPPIRVGEIQVAVCEAYGISLVDLTSARRTAKLVLPRQVAMYLAKVMTGRSLPEIGRRFGGRDHTTVLHAIRKIAAKVEPNDEAPELFDHELSDMIKALRADIEARHGE
jgi:hypothetical protein